MLMRGLFFLLILISCLDLHVLGGPGLRFIENKNQWDKAYDFAANVPGGQMFLNSTGFYYLLKDESKFEELHHNPSARIDEAGNSSDCQTINAHYVTMSWNGTRDVDPKPFGKGKQYFNYYLGSDPARWGVKAYDYEGVLYEDVYSNIDLKIYSSGDHMKYDFIVQPGGDPNLIAGMYAGADNIFLDSNGNLYINTSVGDLIEKKPYAYQFIDGKKRQVECTFDLAGTTIGFLFPDGYDTCEPLVIDPILIFSTYSGSTADNWGSTATPAENGNLYSAGVTNVNAFGGNFPATPGAFQTVYAGAYDVGILKYDSVGQNLLYATYVGGLQSESPHSLVMVPNGDLLVLGTTSSENFPTTPNAINRSFSGGEPVSNVITYELGSDIFIARFNSDGTQLKGSTYLGGSHNDGMNPPSGPLTLNYGDELRGDIITDGDGNIYVSTVTSSDDFPAVNSFQTTYNGGLTDALLLKLSPNLSQLIWGAFIGGGATDSSHTIKVDDEGNIYLAGGTTSADFPVTPGSFKSTLGGTADGWIAKVKGDGTALLNATYTGTDFVEQNYFIDLNSSREIFVYGQTNAGLAFPITPGAFSNPGSGQYLQKYTSDLSSLLVSTVFGSGRGIPNISPTAFLVNECNNIYMTGWGGQLNGLTGNSHWNTNTTGMPITFDAFQKTTSGNDFYFIVLTGDAKNMVYGTYMGGRFSLTHVDGGTSRFDKHGIVYHAVCAGCRASNPTGGPTSDFPTTPGVWSNLNRSPNCNNAAFKFDLSSLIADLKGPLTDVCVQDTVEFLNTSIGGELFFWDFGDGIKIVTPEPVTQKHVYQNAGSYVVKLKVIDEGTCKAVDSTRVNINVGDHVAVVQEDDEICGGTSYSLKATGGVGYQWTSSTGDFTSNEQSPTITPEETTDYYVIVQEPIGCILKDTVTIEVVPKVNTNFEFDKSDFCFGKTNLYVVNTTEDAEDAQMIFYFGDGGTAESMEATHQYQKSDIYKVRLAAIREFCVFEKVIDIPLVNITIPNVMTPEVSSGYNDSFFVQVDDRLDVGPYDFGVPVSMLILNRWGDKVFESTDYLNDWTAPDMASGVYYYEMKIEGETCRSWVHVIK